MKFKVGDTVKSISCTCLGETGIIIQIKTGVTDPYETSFSSGTYWKKGKNLELVQEARSMVDMKPSNPKDVLGIKKAPLTTVPFGPLYELGLAMLEGACKYGRHNYRSIGVRASVYVDAAMGHIASWWEGEDLDPESKISHLSHAQACLTVLRDSQMMGNCVDDRPPKYPDGVNHLRRNPMAAKILERYPNPKKPFVEKKDV